MSAWRTQIAVLAAVTLTLLIGACSTKDASGEVDTRTATGSRQDVAYLLDNVRTMSESRSATTYADSLADYLPNQKFAISGGEPFSLAQGVVRGTVIEAKPGAAYYVPGDAPGADAAEGTVTDFYDERALWRHLEVVLEVQDGVGEVPKSGTIAFTMVSAVPDAAKALRGAAALGEVVVVLQRQGDWKFNPAAYTIAQWGDAFATVNDDGALVFPAFDGQTLDQEFVGGLTTWNALHEEALVDKPLRAVEALGDANR